MSIHLTRILPRLLLTVLVVGIALRPAASLEACGAYIPREGAAGMARERGLVLWDGRTERVLMELTVTGEAGEAAWIFPAPSPAVVELGDSVLLDELEALTAPRVVVERRWTFGPASGAAPEAAGQGVAVLSQQTLGPFEVATLAATEARALRDWLSENGYTFPPGLDAVLAPYVAQGWYYVAARLTPAGQGESLDGQLDPLWITFETEEIVYTMRPAAMAPEPFPLTLYVIADHRVEKAAAFGASRVSYAGFIQPNDLPADSALAPLLPAGRQFLTRFEDSVVPARVDGDFVFTFAPADDAHQDTLTRVEYADASGLIGAAGLGLCALTCLGALGLGGVVLLMRRAGRARSGA